LRNVERRTRYRFDGRGEWLLLCYPRLSATPSTAVVYFCYRADDELALMIYEVRIPLADIHAYCLPVQQGEISAAGLRQSQEKLFYVSPFIEMAMRYHFRVSPPQGHVKLRILETDRDGPLLAATSMASPPLNTVELLRSLFRCRGDAEDHGCDPLGSAAAWLKGARLVPRRTATGNTAWRTTEATIYAPSRCLPAAKRESRSVSCQPGQTAVRWIAMPELISVTSKL